MKIIIRIRLLKYFQSGASKFISEIYLEFVCQSSNKICNSRGDSGEIWRYMHILDSFCYAL